MRFSGLNCFSTTGEGSGKDDHIIAFDDRQVLAYGIENVLHVLRYPLLLDDDLSSRAWPVEKIALPIFTAYGFQQLVLFERLNSLGDHFY